MSKINLFILQGKDADWWANRLFGKSTSLPRHAQRFVTSPGVESKSTMFYWANSPQGHNYWLTLHENSPHLEEAKSFVKWLLKGTVKDESEET